MSVIEVLNSVGLRNPYFERARRRFARLSDDQRSEIEIGFARHRRACAKLDLPPDPCWPAEAIEDILKDSGDLGRRVANDGDGKFEI